MRIRLFDPSAHPRFDDLPWPTDLADWQHPRLVEVQVGLHRHVVRFVDYAGQLYVLKELPQRLAEREYRLLRALNERGLPVVAAVALVDQRGEPDPVIITRFLNYALPFRHLFRAPAGRAAAEVADVLIESLAVLLTRLHTAGFFWGDASLSNAMFRRDGSHLAAFALDTETAELHERLSRGQRRHDLDNAIVNVAGGLADLAAAGELPDDVDPFDVALQLDESYSSIWDELHGASTYDRDHPQALEERLDRINELGFDVSEAVITSDPESNEFRFSPSGVDDGHHRGELARLTGLIAREHQARRLLECISQFRSEREVHRDATLTRAEAGHLWMTEVFSPVMAAIPTELAVKLERPQLFLEVLDHVRASTEGRGDTGRSVPIDDLLAGAHRYGASMLAGRPQERVVTL